MTHGHTFLSKEEMFRTSNLIPYLKQPAELYPMII